MMRRVVFVAAMIVGCVVVANAQEKPFPNRPVDVLVPFSPGGGIDLFFRMLSDELQKTMKVRLNILNQTGGGGAIAADTVANARKDGHTVLGTLLGSLASMTAANPTGRVNLARDFEPIAVLHGYAAVVMVSRGDSELKTLKDVVEYARKRPGELIVATGPVGTSLYLEVKQLERAANVSLTSLPFPGGAQAVTNVLGGHVQLAMTSDVAVKPHITAGKLLGLASDVKSLILPETRTFSELGYPQVNLWASLVLVGPKGLPEGIVRTWENAIKDALRDPAFLAALTKRGFNIDLRTGADQLNKLIKDEIDKYSRFTPEELGWQTK